MREVFEHGTRAALAKRKTQKIDRGGSEKRSKIRRLFGFRKSREAAHPPDPIPITSSSSQGSAESVPEPSSPEAIEEVIVEDGPGSETAETEPKRSKSFTSSESKPTVLLTEESDMIQRGKNEDDNTMRILSRPQGSHKATHTKDSIISPARQGSPECISEPRSSKPNEEAIVKHGTGEKATEDELIRQTLGTQKLRHSMSFTSIESELTLLPSEESNATNDVPFLVFEPNQLPFRHVRELGRGSYAFVDEVEVSNHASNTCSLPFEVVNGGSTFARKVIKIPRKLGTESFMNEVLALKRLRHSHVVGVKLTYEELRKGQWEPRTFGIIMTPIADCTLKTFFDIKDSGSDMHGWDQHSINRTKKWMGCLASGLAYVHTQGVIHKDIKPDNILVTNGHVQFADFGISRTIDIGDVESQTYGLPGPRTAMYVAPEVAAWASRGRKADVFSLGCVFAEMTTVGLGRTLDSFCAWRETDGARAYHRTLDQTLRWLLLLRPAATDRVNYCLAMLNPSTDERIGSHDLASWIACQRDYSPTGLGNRHCKSLGELPVGEFWTTCLQGPPDQLASTGSTDATWDTVRSRYLTRYKWKQESRIEHPLLLESVLPTSATHFQPASDWASFHSLINS